MSDTDGYLDLLDFRRRVFALYDEVRRAASSDPRTAHALWREGRDELFGTHRQSAIPAEGRASFRGLRYFPYDEHFRFAVPLIERSGERYEVQTSAGESMWLRPIGHVEMPIGSLPVFWIDVYGGGLFLPFRDATSGNETYGGGRYVLDTVKGADLGSRPSGDLILDLNFAYNPSCHYDPRWSCPLAGADSRLATRVSAGEMSWDGAHP